jgi:shikimate kinase
MSEPQVVLVGFMGAGKTRVGQALASLLEMEFTDLDAEVATRAGGTIAEIFARDGEAGFRELEAHALDDWLREGVGVLASGGGVVETASALRQLCEHHPVVWLDPPFAELRRRLQAAPRTQRPLVAGRDWEALRLRWEARRPLYGRCSDLHVDEVADSAAALAQRVHRALAEAGLL